MLSNVEHFPVSRTIVAGGRSGEDDVDLKFVGKVVQKVHEIPGDLGSMGRVCDAAFEGRFQH
jgi:hypothetical protein